MYQRNQTKHLGPIRHRLDSAAHLEPRTIPQGYASAEQLVRCCPCDIGIVHPLPCRRQLGVPKSITVDHGTEFMSKALEDWAWQRGVKLDFVRPGGQMKTRT